LLGAGGLWLLYETGEHGAELVYAHGLGVASVRTLQAERDALAQVLQRQQAAAQFERLTEGGWRWTPGPGAEPILTDTFKVLDGTLSAITWTPGSEGLRLTLSETPLLLVGPGTLSGTELRARLRLDSLAGSVRLFTTSRIPGTMTFWSFPGTGCARGDSKMAGCGSSTRRRLKRAAGSTCGSLPTARTSGGT